MLDAIGTFLQAIIDFFSGILFWCLDRCADLWFWFAGIVAQLWVEFWGWLWSLLPASWEENIAEFFELLGGPGGGGVWEYLDDVSWIMPVYPCLGIVTTVYTTSAAIRLGRWVMALIPTIGG